MSLLFLLAFLVLAGINWMAVAGEPAEDRTLEWIAKPAALAALLLFAATGADPSLWLIAALAFSLLGDVYLMLPGKLFLAGLAAFLVGHVFYIVDFDAALFWRLVWLAGVGAASYPLARRIVGSIQDPNLAPAVIAYMAVISLMVASAAASGSVLATLGALSFYCSDAMIGWSRFVGPFENSRLAIMVTYHVGQLLLVLALRAG